MDEIEWCIDDEIPFEIPDSREWCCLGSIIKKLSDGTYSTPKYVPQVIPFISVKDGSADKLKFSNCKYILQAEHDKLYSRCNPEYGDILLTKVRTKEPFSLFVSVALLKYNQSLLNKE